MAVKQQQQTADTATPATRPSRGAEWDEERAEADRELWERRVEYNKREIERFRFSIRTGLEERLKEGALGLDEKDDPDGNDYLLSTLRSIVESMGGHLEVTAVFAGVRLPADVSGTGLLWDAALDEATFQWLLEHD